jgi:hypothetical protein
VASLFEYVLSFSKILSNSIKSAFIVATNSPWRNDLKCAIAIVRERGCWKSKADKRTGTLGVEVSTVVVLYAFGQTAPDQHPGLSFLFPIYGWSQPLYSILSLHPEKIRERNENVSARPTREFFRHSAFYIQTFFFELDKTIENESISLDSGVVAIFPNLTQNQHDRG